MTTFFCALVFKYHYYWFETIQSLHFVKLLVIVPTNQPLVRLKELDFWYSEL